MTAGTAARCDDAAAPVRLAATVLCVIAVVGLVGEWLGLYRGLLRQLIGAASTAYLLLAAAGRPDSRRYHRALLVALGFCWLGDILGPRHFLTGVVMFLCAHLAFLGAFVAAGLDRRRLLPGLAGAAALTGVIAWWILPRAPADQRPLLWAYSAVLAAMLGVAAGTRAGGPRGLLPLAAALFYVSDLCLAQTAFLRGSVAWTYTGYPLYYAACLLFAWSAAPGPRP
jgi:uncharacterized membrane protein YhhN